MDQNLLTDFVAKHAWVQVALAYYALWTVAFKFFNARLQAWFAKVIAAQVEDPDHASMMHDLLEARWYRVTSFALNFLSVKLPTSGDFHKAMAAKDQSNPK